MALQVIDLDAKCNIYSSVTDTGYDSDSSAKLVMIPGGEMNEKICVRDGIPHN